MGGGRCDDVDDIEAFRGEQFFRRLETADARHDVAHRRLGSVRRVGYGNQLHAGTAQDRARMVLSMTPCADERNP